MLRQTVPVPTRAARRLRPPSLDTAQEFAVGQARRRRPGSWSLRNRTTMLFTAALASPAAAVYRLSAVGILAFEARRRIRPPRC
jgi:hypothetical protein